MITVTRSVPRTEHEPARDRAAENPGRWFKLSTYGSYASAQSIVSMIHRGVGLRAFTEAGAFEARIRNEAEVWIRKTT
jgi:hypothetical protein